MQEKAAWGEEVELVQDIFGSESQKGYSCQKMKKELTMEQSYVPVCHRALSSVIYTVYFS